MLDIAASRTSGSPEWWLIRLGTRLAEDAPRFDLLERYWRGDPPMPHGNKKMREAYRRLQRMARTNLGSLVSEAVLERTKVAGFRAGADVDEAVDKEAWSWWQANSLDADSGLVHRAAVVLSRAYVIVGEDPDEAGQPLVTVEDPRQVVHESSPTNRRKVISALKTWWDDVEGCQLAVLYLPERIHYFRSAAAVRADTPNTQRWTPQSWTVDDSITEGGVADNPLGEVPVTPFVNRPDMAGNGLGEYEDVIDILDRINTVVLDRLVISAMQAYRQRWAKGVSMTDENGNTNADFDPGADLLWAVEDEAAQFGEFSATDLTPLIKAIESDVQQLSSITRTPPAYLLAGIVNASGDALAASEVGLVSKIRERQHEFGESWERVYRQVGKQQGREIGRDCEVLWRNPEHRTLAEMASASIQLKASDVPWRTRMRLLDMSPLDIERMEAERANDQLMAGMAQLGAQGLSTVPSVVADNGGRSAPAPTPDPTSAKGVLGGADRTAGNTTTSRDASWDELYARAKAANIKGASGMSKAELIALVGSS